MRNELMTANEVLINNNINYEVKASDIYDNEGRKLGDHKAIYRGDTGQVFQVAKKAMKLFRIARVYHY